MARSILHSLEVRVAQDRHSEDGHHQGDRGDGRHWVAIPKPQEFGEPAPCRLSGEPAPCRLRTLSVCQQPPRSPSCVRTPWSSALRRIMTSLQGNVGDAITSPETRRYYFGTEPAG